MSKRSAQGPQGSKDDEHIFAMSDTPNDAPKRATAAQMAQRKIKTLHSKRPRGTTPTGGTGADQSSNVFGSMSTPSFSAPSASFGAPPPAQTGGFTFGQSQSQSFPGANTGPSEPAQSSSAPFSFGSGGSQGGFNFGGSSGAFGGTSFNNPFANNAGNSTPAAPASSTSFTGFNFGAQTTSQPAQPSQPAFSFGAAKTSTPSTGAGMFGQSNALSSTSSPADSMQMSPDAKPQASTTTPSSSFQSRNIFGDSTSSTFSPKPATPGNPFSNLNIPSTAEKPASDKAEGFAAKPAFAAQTPESSSQTPQFGNLFGAPSTATKPSEPEKPSTTNLFGASSSQSVFSGLSASKPANEQAPQNNIFAPKPATEQTTDKPADANPFKNLFGATPNAPQTSTPQTQASATQNLFAPKPAAEQTPNPAEAQPFKNLFGGAAASSTPKPFESQETNSTSSAPANLFSPKPALGQSTDKPADANPFKNLFGNTATPKTAESTKEQQAPAQNLFAPKPAMQQPAAEAPTTSNMFAQKPAAEPASDKTANANPFGSLMGKPAPAANSSEPDVAKAPSTPAPSLFASSPAKPLASTTPAQQPFGDLFGAKPAVTQQPSVTSSTTTQISKTALPDNVDKSNIELLKRIRMLDVIFKEEVSSYQPGVDRFDGLLIHYMTMRQAMGAPVGSTKDWKAVGASSILDGQVAKESAMSNGPNDSATSSVFAKSFSSPAKANNPPASASTPLKNDVSTSTPMTQAAQNPFAKLSGATPATPSESTPKTVENPFANIKTTTQAPSPQTSVAKDSETTSSPKLANNMFAKPQSSNSQGSAAPPSIPKFGNGTGGMDFFAQFKKKAEADEAKEKAKRKAEDFDSDEDDEEEWERKDAEKQREKRAKLEAASNKKAVFVPGKGFQFVDADEQTQDASQKDDSPKLALPAPSPAPSSGSIFDSSSQPIPASQNIFGRISSTTPQSADNDNDSDASDENETKPRSPKRPASGDSTEDQDDSEAAGHQTKRQKATENGDTLKSSLDTPIPPPTAAAGRSLFDRVESPTPSLASPKPASSGINFGASNSNSTNPFASLGAKSQTSQLFGASFGTGSSQPDSTASPTPADNTWKPSTPIKFAADTNSTPGQASTEASAQTSGAENATSGAATPDEDAAPGAVYDLSSANAGEEEETLVFECRARAFKLTTGWVSQGTGVLRLLKHPKTERARIVIRADPGGNIILNTFLKKELNYARSSNSVQFMVPQADAKPEQWAIRVKPESIEDLHKKIHAIKN